jgi:hypothetical protein
MAASLCERLFPLASGDVMKVVGHVDLGVEDLPGILLVVTRIFSFALPLSGARRSEGTQSDRRTPQDQLRHEPACIANHSLDI